MGTKILPFCSSLLLILCLASHPSAQSFAQNEEQEQQEIKRSDFPDHFLFGTATSSYQIEGAFLEDGRGTSNWDAFSHIPGKIKNNDTGDVADDHYHRFLEDIELMHSMGMNAYRFSISWTRILPRGRFGKINRRGISFYNKVIDRLLLRGIEPFVTIHHHDLPDELDKRYGSWMSSQMQEDFVYFARICFEEFGDRVKHWMTINEPNLVVLMAYIKGVYPPAHCSPPFGNCSVGNSDIEPLIVMHNMLLAHAKAVRLYRTHFQGKQGGSIGLVAFGHMYEPFTDNEFDRQAADRALIFNFAWVYDPIVYGDYPKEMQAILGSQLPRFSKAEKKVLKGSLDYIYVNHYTTLYTKDCLHSICSDDANRPIKGFLDTTGYRDGVSIGDPTGVDRFFVVPRGLEKIINYIKQRYPDKPIFVTENGYSAPLGDSNNVEDMVNDTKRVNYHKNYLASLAKAMRNGADVRGYFAWSLMDNFEWADGYGTRFGLLYVDRQTLERRPKRSAQWFASFLGGHPQAVAKSSSILNTNALDSLM
ncbi:beta-glucosidase 18-like [Cucurbita pepo subsp. pepo]|uniref:beta-glucosidase 18-like n=1 Tax=Cucurbita pepo subsp. pepo TaxID=3664 RepID=UPI000C9D7160|nr:beta-glucosidase 18-like [Cucurbita pepo subsp. pepo]